MNSVGIHDHHINYLVVQDIKSSQYGLVMRRPHIWTPNTDPNYVEWMNPSTHPYLKMYRQPAWIPFDRK